MLPPIDSTVLQNNPEFSLLCTRLKTDVLNPNGSTKRRNAQAERDATSEALKTAQIHASKATIIRSALSSIDLSSAKPIAKEQPKQLPAELVEIILLLTTRLTAPSLSPSSLHTLSTTPQWQSLPQHLPAIGALVSSYLHRQALALARIHSPTTNASYLHRSIPKLAPNIQALRAELAVRREELAEKRIGLVAKTREVLRAYDEAIATIIGILEQHKHGTISRHIKTKADYLSISAQTVSLSLSEKSLRGQKLVYTPEVVQALQTYKENLRDGQERLKERERVARRELWGYGVGREDGEKERVLREIARMYGELTKEYQEVGRDVEKLKGSR